jgi:hypothetical protein
MWFLGATVRSSKKATISYSIVGTSPGRRTGWKCGALGPGKSGVEIPILNYAYFAPEIGAVPEDTFLDRLHSTLTAQS